MVTKEQYDKAKEDQKSSEEIIRNYHKQENERADSRFDEFTKGNHYNDDELLYAAYNLCPCGHGLAYPKECGYKARFWDCSAIWKGIADASVQHTDQLPFSFYNVKSENQPSANGNTTRGVFKPKPKEG